MNKIKLNNLNNFENENDRNMYLKDENNKNSYISLK